MMPLSADSPSLHRPEIRQDITTGEWVIVAPVRARRPHQLIPALSPTLSEVDLACPFCPGQEGQTPPPLLVVPCMDGTAPWALRVVPNKFPALEANGSVSSVPPDPLFPRGAGVGFHEVIIESPQHSGQLAQLPLAHVTLIMHTWRERLRVLQADPRVRCISLFKNHGVRAGASLAHPHTQVLALPLMPATLQRRYNLAQQHHATYGQCLYCTLLASECAVGNRLVCTNACYVAFQPYASRFPCETWIVPRRHQACFGQLADAALPALASLLQECLQRLDLVLHSPDYNLIMYTALRDEAQASFHWSLQITPRVVGLAGFELGTGMAINALVPETAAAWLRRVSLGGSG